MGKERDDKDTAQDIARDLADIAGQLASLKGEANAWLRDLDYDTLRLRLESAHATDSRLALCGGQRRRVRLNYWCICPCAI
jgi:hypothetical protein